MNKGERVGAVLSVDETQINFFGYGIYVGDEIPSKECGGVVGDTLRELKIPNPKIVLDNGDVLYGCECWFWGAEEKVKYMLQNVDIQNVDINDVRRRVNYSRN